MNNFIPGQCWISEMEPELGLGVVVSAEFQRVSIAFKGSDCVRLYASTTAPLKRVCFHAGDRLTAQNGETFTVSKVQEHNGLFTYIGSGFSVPEDQLSGEISFNKPEERLYALHGDDHASFDLRLETLQVRYRLRRSPLRGLRGARVELIPHQFYIAAEAVKRQRPRLLLADEVGLGKTIEACLIMHAMIHRGLAGRVLIVVPDALVNQWFIELLRKFNFTFAIIDHEALDECKHNPFADNQLCICSLSVALEAEKRGEMLTTVGWDLLIIDEAHHLRWFDPIPSEEYLLGEKLTAVIPSVLLLTATPEHYGCAGHFARLKLLDPQRYFSLDSFMKDSKHYQRMAEITGKLIDEQPLDKNETRFINQLLRRDQDAQIQYGNPEKRDEFINDLLDRHGVGRVMYRNTRAAMENFPRRRARLVPLKDQDEEAKVKWLAKFLLDQATEKVLLICADPLTAANIQENLQQQLKIKAAVFHEGMSLIHRDRAAAWFAEEDGAQLLICSEIGSEGRNFQFAHHLVLYDLPLDPELLEQRIGRLDRIGQTEDIKIHVPYQTGTEEEILARWYHEGLDTFEHSLSCGARMMVRFKEELIAAMQSPGDRKMRDKLIADTREFRLQVETELEHGRDKLLEYNSYQPQKINRVLAELKRYDSDHYLQEFMEKMFDYFGIKFEEMSNRSYLLRPDDLLTDAFPSMPRDGMIATCDRAYALGRDDVAFLSWDHPMVIGAVDLFCGSERGNCSFAHLPSKKSMLMLEAAFVLESIAPAKLHLDSFLPPQPLRLLIDNSCRDLTKDYPSDGLSGKLKPLPVRLLSKKLLRELLPNMLEQLRKIAEDSADGVKKAALETMRNDLGHELDRLIALRQINDGIREEEITAMKERIAGLEKFIAAAQLRLDAVRLIFCGILTG